MNITKKLEYHIYDLENALLQPEVRQSAERISELLAEGFMEFGSSGRVYNYTPGDVYDIGSVYEMQDFKARRVSYGCILATYKAVRKDADGNAVSVTLRSSIWRRGGGAWKMVFHQGTITK
jgi:hypothetical protein